MMDTLIAIAGTVVVWLIIPAGLSWLVLRGWRK